MTRGSRALKPMSHGNTLKGRTLKRSMPRISKSILASAMLASAIAIAGCTQTQEIDETMPPYASISDEGRDPPKPPPSQDSGGFMSALGSVLLFPVRMIEAL